MLVISNGVIDMRQTFGDAYKIKNDPASKASSKATADQVMLCKYGEIYAHNGTLLCVWVNGSRLVKRMLRMCPPLIRHQIGDYEATFLFDLSSFDHVAKVVRPYKNRALTIDQRLKLIKAGLAHRYGARSVGVANASDTQKVHNLAVSTQTSGSAPMHVFGVPNLQIAPAQSYEQNHSAKATAAGPVNSRILSLPTGTTRDSLGHTKGIDLCPNSEIQYSGSQEVCRRPLN